MPKGGCLLSDEESTRRTSACEISPKQQHCLHRLTNHPGVSRIVQLKNASVKDAKTCNIGRFTENTRQSRSETRRYLQESGYSGLFLPMVPVIG